MANLIKNSTAVSRTPIFLPKGSSNTYRNTNEFFFYSNSPEEIDTNSLADNGKWLNKVDVSGNGQIYTWHVNGLSSAINSSILVYNPNSYSITISVTNYGTTLSPAGVTISDSEAWENYINGQSKSLTIAAGGFGTLFLLQNIPSSSVYGVVARASIIKTGTSTASTATLYDIAYISNSGGATSCATYVSGKSRGYGDGYFQTINFGTVEMNSSTEQKAYKIAASEGVFSGSECSTITDPSRSYATEYLAGGYGQMFSISLPIKNNTSATRSFKVFIGSLGRFAFPFVYMENDIAKYEYISGFSYVDIIQTDTIAPGATTTPKFTLVIPAVSSTPYVIGVRPI